LDKFFRMKPIEKPKKQKKQNWKEDVLLEKEEDGVKMQLRQLTVKGKSKIVLAEFRILWENSQETDW